MEEELLDYYAGDILPAKAWDSKYAIRSNPYSIAKEITPTQMHWRMAAQIASIEVEYWTKERYGDLSPYGRERFKATTEQNEQGPGAVEDWVFSFLDRYKYIIPQGSIMSMLGNTSVVGSLSNCFVIPSPIDSYGGIFKTDQQIAQLEKRRGGVGTNLNTLRPDGVWVMNSAGTSTGAHSFMDRFSNTTREVAQNGRRGALMLLMDCRHPDIFKFVTKKSDLTKVTGANVSVMLTDKFMSAVKKDEDFFCTFPLNAELTKLAYWDTMPYNKLDSHIFGNEQAHIMKIKARELYELIVEMAWNNGEPGVAFIDNIVEYCPEGVYDDMRPIASNPCGEQWMQAYDACRLLAANLYNMVDDHWKSDASFNEKRAYEVFYIQQRFADNIVDLEIKAVDRIIKKIQSDPEPDDIKANEIELWTNVRRVASNSRRTGCGFTAMADMLAALGLKYDSKEALEVIKKMMKVKLMAEMDCTIDMAIERGPFNGWDPDKEFKLIDNKLYGMNRFYQMICDEFPEQAKRMFKYGRRNVSWSTVAPTGTVSIVALLNKYANCSAGIEPVFSTFHFRNRKVGEKEEADFVDQNGDRWVTYPVVMGGLKEWIEATHNTAAYFGTDNMPKEVLEELFRKSPYYGSCANDIDWEKRIEIQAIVQRYTTNAISSTLNLPNDVDKSVVSHIYETAWMRGLKGVTVYRDGCRTGVMVNEKKTSSFEYKDAVKRPKELDAELHTTSVKGKKYGVIVGKMDNKPYEVFAFDLGLYSQIKPCEGKLVKVKKGQYDFKCEEEHLAGVQNLATNSDEMVLTRLISSLLRHGAKPQFVMEQIDKCELEVVSFGKAVSRILKKYCHEEELIKRSKCSNCESTNLRMQEGCLTCNDCGSSKCG